MQEYEKYAKISIKGFADFAASLGDNDYDYYIGTNCPVAQYLRHVGVPLQSVGVSSWTDQRGKSHPEDLPEIYGNLAGDKPHNFPSLAARLYGYNRTHPQG